MRGRLERILLLGSGAVLALFLVVPVVALVAGTSLGSLVEGAGHPLVAGALRTSAVTTTTATMTVLLTGTPLGWALATSHGRGARVVELLMQLPMVMPPAVAGLALLLVFGRQGAIGAWWPDGLALSTTAVVLAQIFVAAPFYLQAAVAAFRRIDPRLIDVARTLGASPLVVFARVAVPLAWPGLLAGCAMAWARALGEFGATLMFAGNVEGRTQTLPLLIYAALEVDVVVARAVAVLLIAVAIAVLVAVFALTRGTVRQDMPRSGERS